MRILILSVFGHFGAARAAGTLKRAGFAVGVLTQHGSAVARTRYADRVFSLPRKVFREPQGKGVVAELLRAIEEWQPHLLVPGDEPSLRLLHRVVQLADTGRLALRASDRSLLAFSLGDPRYYSAAANKHSVLDLASKLGIRVPQYRVVETLTDAEEFARVHGFPVVLKRDTSYGGHGVAVSRDAEELARQYEKFAFRMHRGKRIKDFLRRALGDELATVYHPADRGLTVQQYVVGQPGMYTVAAVRGRTIAGFAALAERINPSPTGPSTVVRLIVHPEMRAMAELLLAKLGCTGLAAVDFAVEHGTRLPYLLECNARPTQVSHLGGLIGVDLGEALMQGMLRQPFTARTVQHAEVIVPLFPHEWRRDPESPFLQEPTHDVPWDDPDLLRAMIAETHVDRPVQRTESTEKQPPGDWVGGVTQLSSRLQCRQIQHSLGTSSAGQPPFRGVKGFARDDSLPN